jgi:hypothetical protein
MLCCYQSLIDRRLFQEGDSTSNTYYRSNRLCLDGRGIVGSNTWKNGMNSNLNLISILLIGPNNVSKSLSTANFISPEDGYVHCLRGIRFRFHPILFDEFNPNDIEHTSNAHL